MEVLTKSCPRCKRELPATDFWRNASSPTGLQTYCKSCHAVKIREYDRRHPDQYRARHRRAAHRKQAKSFGTTVDDLDGRLAGQSFLCAICRAPESHFRGGRIRRLSLDHDHLTGRPRGYLCAKCNSGIGHFDDDPVRLRRAIRYLAAYRV